MEKSLAILDGEERYASRLLLYFQGQKEFQGFTAAVFTNEECYRRYEQKHPHGLLLCEEAMYRQMLPKPACKTVLLAGKGCVRESAGPPVIFKFQSAQEILEELLGYFEEVDTGVETATCQDNSLVAFFSPTGCRTAALAYALAKQRAKKKSVFYLSLDAFDKPGAREDPVTALSEIIYLLKANSTQIQHALPGLIKKQEHMECLYGVAHWADISECSAAEIRTLLDGIRDTGKYEEIVVDAGAPTDAAAGCMEAAGRIVLLAGREADAVSRENEFLRQELFRDAGVEKKLIRQEPGENMLEELLEKLYGRM